MLPNDSSSVLFYGIPAGALELHRDFIDHADKLDTLLFKDKRGVILI